VGRRQGAVRFRFGDEEIECHPGDTIAAALTAAGHYEFGRGGDGSSRAVFCGMGVCQACLVVVQGGGVRRACMEPAVEGSSVEPYPGVSEITTAAESPPVDGCRNADEEPDLLVVGGGPAGLSAACTAAELGIDVVVLDERSQPGGQYYKQPASARPIPPAIAGDRQFRDGRRLIDRARAAGVRIVSGATVWGAFPGPELAVTVSGYTRLYRPRRLLVAAGAYERAAPFPGWTEPGVMTTGAAQTLLRSYGVLAGRRVLVAGNGPLNLQVALELERAGASIEFLCESARIVRPGAVIHYLRMLLTSPLLAFRGATHLLQLRLRRVPFRSGWGVGAVRRGDDGLEVDVGPIRSGGIETRKTLLVDAVCTGYGFLPNNELLRMLGCRHEYDDKRDYLTTLRNEDCATSVDGVFAIGDCCGLGGAPAAAEEGTLAAHAIADSLAAAGQPGKRARERHAARRRLATHRRFQHALWRLFEARIPAADLALADTPLCRCERVTVAELATAIEEGCLSLADLKQTTRLGMGPCQGRYCTSLALSVLPRPPEAALREFSMFAPQAPLKPLTIEELCSGHESG
jgi:thioredoxin reductase